MKIKARKPFISGIYAAEKGETITIPDATAEKLIVYGIAETAGETPAPTPKPARSPKTGAKKQCQNGA